MWREIGEGKKDVNWGVRKERDWVRDR